MLIDMDAIRCQLNEITRDEFISFIESHIGNLFDPEVIRQTLLDDEAFVEYKTLLVSAITSSTDDTKCIEIKKETVDEISLTSSSSTTTTTNLEIKKEPTTTVKKFDDKKHHYDVKIKKIKKEKKSKKVESGYNKKYKTAEFQAEYNRYRKKYKLQTVRVILHDVCKQKQVKSNISHKINRAQTSITEKKIKKESSSFVGHAHNNIILNERGVRILPWEMKDSIKKSKIVKKPKVIRLYDEEKKKREEKPLKLENMTAKTSWILTRIEECLQPNPPKRRIPIAPLVNKEKTISIFDTPSPPELMSNKDKVKSIFDTPSPLSKIPVRKYENIIVDDEPIKFVDLTQEVDLDYHPQHHEETWEPQVSTMKERYGEDKKIEDKNVEVKEKEVKVQKDVKIEVDEDNFSDFDEDAFSQCSYPLIAPPPLTRLVVNENSVAVQECLLDQTKLTLPIDDLDSTSRLIHNITRWFLANEREPFFQSSPNSPEDDEEDFQTMAEMCGTLEEKNDFVIDDLDEEEYDWNSDDKIGATLVDHKAHIRIGGNGTEEISGESKHKELILDSKYFLKIITLPRGFTYNSEQLKATCNICNGQEIKGSPELGDHVNSFQHRENVLRLSRKLIKSPPPKITTNPEEECREALKTEQLKLTEASRWTFELEGRWRLKDDAREELKRNHQLKRARFLENNPNEHPLYDEGWSKFWERRHDEITASRGSLYADAYDYTKEWKEEWDKLMELEFRKEYFNKLHDIYRKYKVDFESLRTIWNLPLPAPEQVFTDNKEFNLSLPGLDMPPVPVTPVKIPKPPPPPRLYDSPPKNVAAGLLPKPTIGPTTSPAVRNLSQNHFKTHEKDSPISDTQFHYGRWSHKTHEKDSPFSDTQFQHGRSYKTHEKETFISDTRFHHGGRSHKTHEKDSPISDTQFHHGRRSYNNWDDKY